jgi:hypothetical protein
MAGLCVVVASKAHSRSDMEVRRGRLLYSLFGVSAV